MLTDMVDTWSSISYSMLVFSSGYFIYDFFDVYINFKFFKQWDIIIHHVVVVASLQFAIYTEKQCGSATCSFLMEVNSIFLHARTLLRMSEKNNSSWYSANGVFLLGTFVCFRLMTSAWLVKWSVMNRHILPTVHFAVPFSFGVLLTILNIRLFYRLWNSEFQGRNLNKEKVS